MFDTEEARKVPMGHGLWDAKCSRCDWFYRGQCRMVDMAVRSHVQGCGGDVTAHDESGATVLSLERDVRGRVIHTPPDRTAEEIAQDAIEEGARRLTDPSQYWKVKPVGEDPWTEGDLQ